MSAARVVAAFALAGWGIGGCTGETPRPVVTADVNGASDKRTADSPSVRPDVSAEVGGADPLDGGLDALSTTDATPDDALDAADGRDADAMAPILDVLEDSQGGDTAEPGAPDAGPGCQGCCYDIAHDVAPVYDPPPVDPKTCGPMLDLRCNTDGDCVARYSNWNHYRWPVSRQDPYVKIFKYWIDSTDGSCEVSYWFLEGDAGECGPVQVKCVDCVCLGFDWHEHANASKPPCTVFPDDEQIKPTNAP